MNDAAQRRNPEISVADIMTKELVTLKVEDTLRLADDMMNLMRVRHFPVFDGDRVAGVLNQSDLLHASMASLISHRNDTPREALGAVVVKDVMKPAPVVSPDLSIQRAAEIMVEETVECLLVVKDKKLVGLVSRTDLLRALAKR